MFGKVSMVVDELNQYSFSSQSMTGIMPLLASKSKFFIGSCVLGRLQ